MGQHIWPQYPQEVLSSFVDGWYSFPSRNTVSRHVPFKVFWHFCLYVWVKGFYLVVTKTWNLCFVAQSVWLHVSSSSDLAWPKVRVWILSQCHAPHAPRPPIRSGHTFRHVFISSNLVIIVKWLRCGVSLGIFSSPSSFDWGLCSSLTLRTFQEGK